MSALLNSSVSVSTESLNPDQLRPSTLVVQPLTNLAGSTPQTLRQSLSAALEQVTDQVIVDLLWVSQSDLTGIRVLIGAMQQATAAGKSLILQGMNGNLKTAIAQEIASQQEQAFGPRQDWFNADLGNYCDRH